MKNFARIVGVSVVSFVVIVAIPASTVKHYYCKYCGHKTTSVNSLTASLCQRHSDGALKGRHAPAPWGCWWGQTLQKFGGLYAS